MYIYLNIIRMIIINKMFRVMLNSAPGAMVKHTKKENKRKVKY
jgi:hypothetical protein